MNESKHAHKLLDGLKGIEVGGGAHNAFGLNTVNVDYTDAMTGYKEWEVNAIGEFMPVDIVAWAWSIPVPDKSYDFVISSHVIEHIWDPIEALQEWCRIARKWIYIICPHRDATPQDAAKELTTLEEIIYRHANSVNQEEELGHVSRWTPDDFVIMCQHFGFHVHDMLPVDDKVGNGFTVVIDVEKSVKWER